MDISFYSLLSFIIVTILYFAFGKPKLTLNDLDVNSGSITTDYYNKNIKSLFYYLGFVVVIQFAINVGYLMNKCNGSLDKNIGSAALFTFIPWILIFGILLAVLVMFPGFKGAFADVLGYYAVAGSANSLFSELLISTDIKNMIQNVGEENAQKDKLTMAAEAIMKICGNKSILINQINPDNFLGIWDTLKPLMLPSALTNEMSLKQQLLDLVSLKENIGEGIWYIYTAILISSIVYYNLATRGCIKSISQIKTDHDAYIKTKEEADKQQELNNSTTYVMS